MAIVKAESYRKGIVSSTIFNFIAKGISFLNSLLVVYLFGSNFKTDLYFLIVATVTLFSTFINGIDLLVLIPESMRIRTKFGEEAENSFLNFFIRLYLIIGISISAFVFFFPDQFYSLFSKYTIQDLNGQKLMLLISSVMFPIQLLNSLFTSILTSKRFFTVPMFVSLINSIVSIILLFVLKPFFSTTSIVISLAIGYAINFSWLVITMRQKLSWSFLKVFNTPQRKIFSDILFMELNIFPITFKSYITYFLLSGLGAGIITSYNYGQQIALIPEMLIVTQVISVVGIKFNEMSSFNDRDEINKFFSETMNMLLLITLPVALMMFLLSHEISFEIFRYAHKSNSDIIGNISFILMFFVLSLPARAFDMMMTRLIMAQQKIKLGVIFSVFGQIIISLLIYVGLKTFELKGYLWAYLGGYYIVIPAMYFLLVRKACPFISLSKWLISALPFIGFNILLVLFLAFIKDTLLQNLPELLNIVIIGVFYLVSIALINRVIRFYDPLNSVLDRLKFRK
ncbi:MAG: hypothetical protein JSU05_01545 [Bacteroidetes bacterium]|nr:hypothetical protein [Bacteroidota bacterium]